MRKYTALLIAVAFSFGLAGSALAHLPEGYMYFAFQFPDHLVPSMDGDLGDWDFVPDVYRIDNENHMIESFVQENRDPGGAFDASTLVLNAIIGWNETQNRMIFTTWYWDDMHQVDRAAEAGGLMHTDDCIEIMIDADHTGGKFRGLGETDEEKRRLECSQAQRYAISEPAPDARGFRSANFGAWTEAKGGVNADWGWSYDGVLMGEGMLYCEFSIRPWDDLNFEGPDVSLEHDLEEGEIIGMNLSYGDFDETDDYMSYWTHSGGSGTTSNASVLADFLLMEVEEGLPDAPTAVEQGSWGRIKASFNR
jgi:hypothetical protein